VVGDKFADQEEHESDDAENAQNKNEVRREPVFFLAFIQHDLQRANAQRKIADAPVVHAAFSALDVWRIVNEQHGHDYGGDQDRSELNMARRLVTPSSIDPLPSAISHRPFAISHQPSAISHDDDQ